MLARTAARDLPAVETDLYVPPELWSQVSTAEILAGTPRGGLDAKQLSFMSALSPEGHPVRVDVAGDLSLLKHPCVSVVGTRKVSHEGAARARRLARDLVRQGIVVVSGLAEGVDTEAITSAIESGGRTVGVIGTPIDRAYPAKNSRLQELVYRDHLLISQFPIGSTVHKSNFPQRNRLMALLSDATVIIEAGNTSGTLHQAAECIRLKRWLFIAQSVLDDLSLTWPAKFLKEPMCVALKDVGDVTSRVLRG